MQRTATFLLRGGLDLVTPAIAVDPGRCIGAENYEADAKGYRRIAGAERLDGRGKPSAASYWLLDFDQGVTAVAEGDVVTGATSGATGKALVAGVIESGTLGGSDAAGFLVLTDVTGTFQDNENLEVAASTVAVADGTARERAALNDTDDTTWFRDAVATRRALIQKPAGEGAIRGVWTYKGDVYCVRDNVGATAGVLYKATTSGWAAQSLGHILRFDAGSTTFSEGDTVTGGTSSATATVRRVVLSSGSWSSGNAAGFLVVSDISGTFADNESITSGAGAATANGTTVANALPAGGRYDFLNHNFFGAAATERMYGVNGVGRGFEWDGTYFTPIETGLAVGIDKPTRIAVYKNHLFLAYAGGSIQFSETGNPLGYQVSLGAGEIGFGSTVSDLEEAAATALFIVGDRRIGYLTGNDKDDFVLAILSDEAGGKAWTAANLGGIMYMDDAGVRRAEATQAFGDFRTGTLTQLVEPLFESKRKAGANPVGAMRVRARDIYRLFFDDGAVVSIYIGAREPQAMPLQYNFTASCLCSGEDANGYEMLLAGSTDGWVYELDRGTSFDGEDIEAFARFVFNNIGSPSQRKRFHKVTAEVQTGATITTLFLASDFAYGSPNQPPSVEQQFDLAASGGFWDIAEWNEFQWSSQIVGQAEAYPDGFGQNVSLAVMSTATHEEPHTLSAITINYSIRGLIR